MAAEQTITLLDRLRQCELLTSAQMEELAALPEALDSDPRVLGRILLRREWLTRFQINQVAVGRGKELIVGPYVVLDRLGEGGMGQVFKARHQHMQRVVALKLIRKEKLANEEAVKRFYREVQAAAQLQHANIVVAYDAGPAGNTHYFAMEYIEGSDLARLIRDAGPLPSGQACDYVRQAALGLQHAHERGMVHRDIKPANLFVSWDAAGTAVVKILDMGLARIQAAGEGEKALTQTGQVMGTPDYLAPEQAINARSADIRSDLYSLGCTLYYLLAGRPPFSGDSLAQVLLKHQMAEPEAPAGGWGEIPAEVRKVLNKLLAKEPSQRYQTPQELVAALGPLCGGTAKVAVTGKTAGSDPATSDTGWPTLTGAENEAARRPTKKKTGDTTEPAAAKRKKGKKRASESKDRRLLLIGGGVALAVVILVGLLIALARRPGKEQRGTDPGALSADTQNGDSRGVSGELPQVITVKIEDLPAAVSPSPRPAPQQTAPVEQPQAPANRPVPLPTARPVPPPPAAKPLAPPSGQSPLDHLDPARISAKLRPGIPASLPVVAVLPGHADALLGVVFSPEGKQLAVTSRDGALRVWDLSGAEPKNVLDFADRTSPLGSPTYSPDGKMLAVATATTVMLFDSSGPSPVGIQGLPGCTLSPDEGQNPFPEQVLGFFPGGKFLAGTCTQALPNSKDRIVRPTINVWRFAPNVRIINTHSLVRGVDHCLAVAPDCLVATGGEGKALHTKLYDRFGQGQNFSTGYSELSDVITAMVFAPDGKSLMVTTKDGMLAVYSDTTGKGLTARIRGISKKKAHDGWATIVGFTPDGQTFMTRGEDRYITWWSTPQKARLREWQLPEGCGLWRFSPDGYYAAVQVPDQRIAIIRLPAPFQQP
jgi:serine/threonine protein kinase/WD40 repeat protein